MNKYSIISVVLIICTLNFIPPHQNVKASNLCSTANISVQEVYFLENTSLNYTVDIYRNVSEGNFECNSSPAKVVIIVSKIIHLNVLSFLLKANRFGKGKIQCRCQSQVENVTFDILNVSIEKKKTFMDNILRILIWTFLVPLMFLVGCSTEIESIWSHSKKPMPLLIVLFAQYVIMPLLAFGISKLFFLNNEFGFGLLAVSCSPSCITSNMWTILYKGEKDLGLTLTFVSTLFSLFMIPFWVFCLGRFYFDFKIAQIPIRNIFLGVLQVVVPVVLGLIFRYKWKRWGLKLLKVFKILSIIFIWFLLTFGLYVNLYVFEVILDYPHLVPIVAVLPWCGFLFGLLIGIGSKHGFVQSKTISIKIGVQNIGFAILIVKYSMQGLYSDFGILIPFIILISSHALLLVGYICKLIFVKFHKKVVRNEENLMNFPVSSYTIYQPVFLLNDNLLKGKESVIEPTLYYTEEPSECLDNTIEDYL
uniref:Slc10a-1 n=1 Tax=Schmidtea mediterranea TaxID=79327 RepID=A0A0H3YK44_SCHMD|nr:slc10a-1 [Schmidtea mediterranea]